MANEIQTTMRNTPKVLIVDDRPENLVALAKILKPLDIIIIKANSGNEAIASVLEHDFAVILLDVQMPDMDGFETATLLREYEKSRRTPIIFVTAISKEPANVFEGYDAGAIDYLFKPVDARILKSKVNIFVELFRENRDQLKQLINELELAKAELEKNNIELEKIARKDSLTSLPNRLLFEESAIKIMANYKRNDKCFALLLLDVDKFKTINDTLGHDVGDIVLKTVAERIKHTLREDDVVARLGGDEFAIILTDVNDERHAGIVANKIIREVSNDLVIEGKIIRTGISVGISCLTSAEDSLASLLKSADVALYQAKKHGRNQAFFYTSELNEVHYRRTKIENDLHSAILEDELYLVFQPILSIKNKNIIGMEALLRWEHSEFGLIEPIEFLSIAESAGFSNKLTEWLLEQSFKHFAHLQESYGLHMFFSVNLSDSQLVHNDYLFENICRLQQKYSISASQFVIEVTENALMCQENDMPIKAIKHLNDLGVGISIDCFGMGYSSLNKLQKMPINSLKIDCTFISEISKKEDVILAKAVIDLAINLKLDVIAEGVETKEQEQFLLENKCEIAQGSLYSKPLSVDGISALLQEAFSEI